MKYKHVDKVFNKIENGVTEPLDALLCTGDRVIAKKYNNVQGNLVLVNEYICYRLCVILSIPIPDAGIAIIDDRTQNENSQELITPENHGPCFYSKRIDKAAPVNASIIDRIANKEDFYRIVLFDHLIYNKDRNRGNIIIRTGKTVYMYAIDHSHVFKNQCIWDRFCFTQGMRTGDFADRDIMGFNEDMYDIFWQNMSKNRVTLLNLAEEFKSKIQYNLLNEIVSELPKEWEVSEEDLSALKEYIIYRLEHLNEICEVIVRR